MWGVTAEDDKEAAMMGIEKTVSYFHSIGMPTSFGENKDIGVLEDNTLHDMAYCCTYQRTRTIRKLQGAWRRRFTRFISRRIGKEKGRSKMNSGSAFRLNSNLCTLELLTDTYLQNKAAAAPKFSSSCQGSSEVFLS